MTEATIGEARARRRIPTTAIVIAMLFVAPLFIPIGDTLRFLIEWVGSFGPWGPAALIVAHGLIVLLLVPNSWPIIAAGVLFGPLWGTVVGWAGSMLGGLFAVLLGRGFARERVEKKLSDNPRAARIDRAVAERGWKVVAVIRLSPFVPYALINYVLGLSSIRLWVLGVVTGLCIIPSTALYAWFGAIGRTGLEGEGGLPADPSDWALVGLGLAMTVFAAVYVRRVVADAIDEP